MGSPDNRRLANDIIETNWQLSIGGCNFSNRLKSLEWIFDKVELISSPMDDANEIRGVEKRDIRNIVFLAKCMRAVAIAHRASQAVSGPGWLEAPLPNTQH